MQWLTWEWVEQQVAFTIVTTVVASAILIPLGHFAVKRIKNWLDPKTKGGLGDLPAPDGQPNHEYLAEKAEKGAP